MDQNSSYQRQWEVEQKYIVENIGALVARLEELAAIECHSQRHVDVYLAHPERDFRKSDEAFRLRRVNDQACVTYKGPRLTGPVKTRPEIELKIDADQFDQWLAMMEHLGFRPLPAVRKLRRQFDLAFAQRQFNIAIDDVEQLGHFAEIELLVADQSDLPSARSAVEALGNALGLNRVQPKSYLSQLLSKLGHPYS